METSLGAVLGRASLGLRHVAGRLDLTRPVRWVAVSELPDPTPYLEGGELLLTTGLELPVADDGAVTAYVERIHRRGVVALGLGTGIRHEVPPPALLRAVASVGLPLIEVPAPTPFIAVTRAVADLVAAAEREDVTRSLAAHRRLTGAALHEDGVTGVTRELARLLDGWAVVTDAEGTVAAEAGSVPDEVRAQIAAEVVRLGPQGLRGAASVSGPGGPFVVHPLGVSGRPHRYLVAGRRAPFDVPARSAVAASVSLMSLWLQRSGSDRGMAQRIRRAAADLLVAGRTEPAGPLLAVLDDAAVYPAADGLVVLVTVAPEGGVDGPDLPAGLVTEDSGDLVVLAPAGRAASVAGDLASTDGGAVVGMSGAVAPELVPQALREARAARAAASGPGVVRFSDVLADGLPALVDRAAGVSWAAALLAPLRGDGEAGGVELRRSLRVYLAHHGQWQPAAGELGVHRHTLRYRMARVEQLLGVSLSSPQVRMNLWFALQIAPPA